MEQVKLPQRHATQSSGAFSYHLDDAESREIMQQFKMTKKQDKTSEDRSNAMKKWGTTEDNTKKMIQILNPDGQVLDNEDDSESDMSESASASDKEEAKDNKKAGHLNVKADDNKSVASSRRSKFSNSRSKARMLNDLKVPK